MANNCHDPDCSGGHESCRWCEYEWRLRYLQISLGYEYEKWNVRRDEEMYRDEIRAILRCYQGEPNV